MQLIIDSGSTKTEWLVVENSVVVKRIFTKGINPFYQTESEIKSEIEYFLIPELGELSISQIYFYGAGCSFPEKKATVCNALGFYFKHIPIEVQSDLLAAARSLFGAEKGIACILGTGSNSCYYDGSEIVNNVSPLGFILGDEGSGAVLSKTFVSDCLKNQIPADLRIAFMNEYHLTAEGILEDIYKKPFPNRYLAAFTPFLSEHISESSVYDIVYAGFVSFFKRNVMQYDFQTMKTSFIGSVGFYFKDLLLKAAAECGVTVDAVEKSPMPGLIKYHTTNR
ncbi:MAG: ATPase [Bacteroidales bacterium]|nr:ATPase [Bacteroidales bacterium]